MNGFIFQIIDTVIGRWNQGQYTRALRKVRGQDLIFLKNNVFFQIFSDTCIPQLNAMLDIKNLYQILIS